MTKWGFPTDTTNPSNSPARSLRIVFVPSARTWNDAGTGRRATWIGEVPQEIPEGALRSVEVRRGAQDPPLRVRSKVAGLEPPPDLGLLEFVGPRAGFEYVLSKVEGELFLRTPEGIPLHLDPIPRGEGFRDALLANFFHLFLNDKLRRPGITHRGSYP